jgi:hypothetical protein
MPCQLHANHANGWCLIGMQLVAHWLQLAAIGTRRNPLAFDWVPLAYTLAHDWALIGSQLA